jgi:ABC-type nitrate/sulfonate/bicarbonate transport system ATPase subunit
MIEIQHVSHAFGAADRRGDALPVLRDINLAIPDGTFVSILGPSGCGKTTLLRILHGLARPSSGRVIVDGRPVDRPSPDRAMVFQEFNLLPWRTAVANAAFGAEVQARPASLRARLAGGALRLVGLGQFGRRYPHELSGGMKQRVGLARALCTAPRYLLMDEPFAALDLQSRELMQAELLRLWEADRKTVVFVTHSVDEAIVLSDRIVVLSARPATVVQTVDVDLPRPRCAADRDVRSSAAFLEYRQRLWHLLRQEIREEVGTWR